MKRLARVVRLRPDKRDEYLRLHAAAWPEVLQALRDARIANYSLFERDGLVFSYFEYTDDDYEADRARLLASPAMQRWNKLTLPCLEPIDPAAPLFADMDEIFHMG